jgi:hypothetical protein
MRALDPNHRCPTQTPCSAHGSRAQFNSKNCLREICSAYSKQKPTVVVYEPDPAKGGAAIPELRADCPERHPGFSPTGQLLEHSEAKRLRSYVFPDTAHPPIPWQRIFELQLVSLKMIAARVISVSNSITNKAPVEVQEVAIDGELSSKKLAFARPVVLWASDSNPGATSVATDLVAALSKMADSAGRKAGGTSESFRKSNRPTVTLASRPPPELDPEDVNGANGECAQDEDSATHMLLYLNEETWSGDCAKLHRQVDAVRAAGIPILMLHERDPAASACEFGRFFETQLRQSNLVMWLRACHPTMHSPSIPPLQDAARVDHWRPLQGTRNRVAPWRLSRRLHRASWHGAQFKRRRAVEHGGRAVTPEADSARVRRASKLGEGSFGDASHGAPGGSPARARDRE